MKILQLVFFFFYATFIIAQDGSILREHTKEQLLADYDLAIKSLKEAHPGLYWYTSYLEYEEIIRTNRNRIKEGMNSYEFYRILSYVVSADREGHSRVGSSKDIGVYFRKKAKFLPFSIKTINQELHITNDFSSAPTKGKTITKINNIPVDTILARIFENISRYSDGFSTTGKYKLMDRFGFSSYYVDFISDFKSDEISVELLNPKNSQAETQIINLISRDSLVRIAKQVPRKKRKHDHQLYNLEINKNTAILTFNDLGYGKYEKQNLIFADLVDSLFQNIRERECENLIIDVRNVGGGSEGAEDYIFSYLTSTPYRKYKYVQPSSFSYSFLDYTDYKDDRSVLEKMLTDEHELSSDGRILRKEGVLPTESPKANPFSGNLYMLISGKTYSGGSEFASIAKSNSNAIFIGEETGGGFYGQTSGFYVFLLLPNTQIEIRIPLLKFATTFESKDIPYGRGVIPDYKVEQSFNDFMNEVDTEMEFALKLIETNK